MPSGSFLNPLLNVAIVPGFFAAKKSTLKMIFIFSERSYLWLWKFMNSSSSNKKKKVATVSLSKLSAAKGRSLTSCPFEQPAAIGFREIVSKFI